MRKNRMMRLASILLVCVLLSTSVISGTFAKYTTTASGTDSARVAEWGVNVAVNSADSLFSVTYATDEDPAAKDEEGNDISISVSGEANPTTNNEKVVAPGTAGAMTFSITGAPEVAVAVSVNFGTISMITLPENTITIKEAVGEEEAVKNKEYYPIKWTLKRSDASPENDNWDQVAAIDNLNGVSLDKIQAYFANTDTVNGKNGNYAPNTNLATVFGYYQLSWEWVFEDSNINGVNLMDTYLGDQMVNHTNTAVKLEESFNLSITVTQIG